MRWRIKVVYANGMILEVVRPGLTSGDVLGRFFREKRQREETEEVVCVLVNPE